MGAGDHGRMGVKDRFGGSGAPWELIKEFEVSEEPIAPSEVTDNPFGISRRYHLTFIPMSWACKAHGNSKRSAIQ